MSSRELWPPIAGIRALKRAVEESGGTPVVLIDGPSGAGKSTLADRLVDEWPTGARPQLVRLDDIYPGWDGLDAASELLVDELLEPRSRGASAGWRRFDWAADRPAEWHEIDPARSLLVEGCGALSIRSSAFADIRIWITADDAVRKVRALARDGGSFDAHWDSWQAQWERFVARERPEELAGFHIDADLDAAEKPRLLGPNPGEWV
ncbi:ATP-binding protein [Luethyella okanaganae]|uniref:ATP-binding protein n=1 Tax=Luethyella okanaganae TaxID=69372 RepID=A0ABW1VE54_9MICO